MSLWPEAQAQSSTPERKTICHLTTRYDTRDLIALPRVATMPIQAGTQWIHLSSGVPKTL